MSCLVLMCGLPGSGKTTMARRIEVSRDAVRFSSDEWMTVLGISGKDSDARIRVERIQWDLAQHLLGRGRVVVLENGFWRRSERDALREWARTAGIAVELRFCDADLDELWRRIRERNAKIVDTTMVISRAELDEWAGDFEAPGMHELELFDPPVS